MSFELLKSEVQAGIEGKNCGIPMGFKRLNRYIGIRKRTMTLIFGPTGCLHKDSIVWIGRKTSSSHAKPMSIEELYLRFHDLHQGSHWRKDHPTKIRVYKPDIGQTGMHNILNVVKSGNKNLFELETSSGKKIRATKDHKFMINTENLNEEITFKKLEDLKIGDKVVCKSEKHSRKRGKKLKNRKEICGKMPYYWTARKKKVLGIEYQRVYDYRAIYDANLNNLSLEDFLDIVSNDKTHNLVLSNPKMVIHHIDENPLNNDISNLKLISKSEHDKLHTKTSNFGFSWVHYENIISITEIGEQMTYDIVCDDPYHNFISDEFVVHNSGKSAYLHHAYILSPFDWYLENKPKDTKLKIILFSMERSKVYVLAKWISRKIFLDQGVLIPIQRLLGWWTGEKLTKDEHDLFLHFEWYINELLEVVDIIEGPQNPTAIYKYVKKYALDNGRIEEINEYHKVYVPNHSNEIVLIGEDHLGLTKLESGMKTKKEAIDKVSEYNQYFRDFFGYSPLPVSQLVRGLNNPMYQKMDSFEPTIDDVKESGRPGEDSDIVVSTFEPLRFRTNDKDYDAERFVDKTNGAKYFRSIQILKNSFGEDGVRAGMGFMGSTGIFAELPKASSMESFDYESIYNNTFFLMNK